MEPSELTGDGNHAVSLFHYLHIPVRHGQQKSTKIITEWLNKIYVLTKAQRLKDQTNDLNVFANYVCFMSVSSSSKSFRHPSLASPKCQFLQIIGDSHPSNLKPAVVFKSPSVDYLCFLFPMTPSDIWIPTGYMPSIVPIKVENCDCVTLYVDISNICIRDILSTLTSGFIYLMH